MAQRQELARIVDAMGDNGRLRQQGAKLFPDIGMLFGEGGIQGNAQGQAFVLEDRSYPGNAPIDGVLTEGFVDNIGIPARRIRPEIRTLPIAPDLDVEDETDGDFLAVGPRPDMDGLARQPSDPIAGRL